MKYKLDEVKNLASGIDHSEGICLGVDGNLYLGGEAGQIYRLTLEGELREVAHLENGGIGYGASEILNYNRQPLITLNSGSSAQVAPIVSNGKIVVMNGFVKYPK